LSEHLGHPVLLKMDTLQPSGSFKIRGIGQRCINAVRDGSRHFVSSSGGNAGLAVAFSGKALKIPTTVVVPETTPSYMVGKIRSYGAQVVVYGKVWDEANKHAVELAKQPGHVLIHPFDHPDLWDGHASIIREVKDQIGEFGFTKPGVVVTVVGGGGLLKGLLQGLDEVGWSDVPVLACETKGADSFSQALQSGKLVTLPAISSIARSLGALTVCPSVLEHSLSRNSQYPSSLQSVVLSDPQALVACARFADDQRVLVEPACGVGLALVYEKGSALLKLIEKTNAPVLVVVCGGNMVSVEDVVKWRSAL